MLERTRSPAAELVRRGLPADTAPAVGRLGLLDGTAEASRVLDELAGAGDPGRAVQGLERLVERDPAGRDVLARLRDASGLRQRLIAVLGASTALADHLAAVPGLWRELGDGDRIQLRPSAYGLRRSLLAAVGADQGDPLPGRSGAVPAAGAGPEVLDALRLAYRTAQLHVAVRDLTAGLAVDDVAAELADLAAAALDAALAVALAGLPVDAAPCRLAVIGMGKCGGRELNYVSDVDVVLVAEPVQGSEAAALETAERLATGLIAICGTATPAGILFPLDLGLRPEGRSGPLVRTLASHAAYYQRWARAWEFQALLKARPVAGDLALGSAYVDELAPLVWSAAGAEGFVAEVRAMRRRVEQSVPRAQAGRELKLGPGGLRDVEFAVQLLQLVHGRADPALRSGSTLEALEALRDGGYVGVDDADTLAAAYRWLRTAEHRLQLQALRRTHSLPTEPADRRWLARTMGYRSTAGLDALDAFDAARVAQAAVTRRLHEKLLYRPLLEAAARLPADASRVDGRLTPESARTRLRALGFTDTDGAWRHLRALTAGVSRRAAIQRTLLPVLLDTFASAADPDAGLLAFRRVSDALGDTPWFLRQLRDEGQAAQNLGLLLGSSRYVADLLVRTPEAVAVVADDAQLEVRSRAQLEGAFGAVAERAEDWEAAAAAARGLRRGELLRVASADILGRLRPGEVGRALSDAAGATVAAALIIAARKVRAANHGRLPIRISIIALGRLGGGELGYGSDADVMFVHEALPGVADTLAWEAARAVAEETRRLLALPAPDPPLQLDAGLRPEGRQGPLSRTLASCAAYYRRWGQTWERQALLRAAPCAGDPALTARFLSEVADPYRYPETFTEEQAAEVRRLKGRMEAERLPRFTDRTANLKLGPGGLSDVEWTVQLLQLQHAGTLPALRTPRTLEALAACEQEGLVTPDDAALLEAAWSQAAQLRNAVMLVTGRASDTLPREPRQLAGVASLLGYPADPAGARAVAADHRELAGAAREAVVRIFGRPG